MTEVEYGGGGHRTRLRDQEINCCLYGVPPGHVYKGVEEERAGQEEEARPRGSPTPGGSRIPPSQVGVGEGREGGVGEKERGAAPPKPIHIRPPT